MHFILSIQCNDGTYNFVFKSENDSIFFEDTKLKSLPPSDSESKSVYINYVHEYGDEVARILCHFNFEMYGDLDHPHVCEFSDIIDALLIRLIRKEPMSGYYTITDSELIVQSTGKTYALGQFFENDSNLDYYQILATLH